MYSTYMDRTSMTSLQAAEPVVVNVYGAQEPIPPDREPIPPDRESIPGLPKKVYKDGLWYRIYTVHASASLCNILIRINSIRQLPYFFIR
jgi:hypothetical protein